MIATIVLSMAIFLTAGVIIYRHVTGKAKHCEQCNSGCPVKQAQTTNEKNR